MNLGTATAARMPISTSTEMISIRVKPFSERKIGFLSIFLLLFPVPSKWASGIILFIGANRMLPASSRGSVSFSDNNHDMLRKLYGRELFFSNFRRQFYFFPVLFLFFRLFIGFPLLFLFFFMRQCRARICDQGGGGHWWRTPREGPPWNDTRPEGLRTGGPQLTAGHGRPVCQPSCNGDQAAEQRLEAMPPAGFPRST